MEETIRVFVSERFKATIGKTAIGSDTPLFSSGIVDSFGVLELIAFLEQTYGITVADEEIVPENLDSIDNMTSYLSTKLAAA